MRSLKNKIWLIPLLLFTGFTVTYGQYFGRNKPKYQKFDFEVLQTPNFDIYHYLDNDTTIEDLGVLSERWYKRHQKVLEDTFKQKNPLIVYNHHAEFQQTDVISGMVGVGTGGVTEALKNRVVFPFMFTNKQTDHVLGHELVHAFQFHLITKGDSTNLSSLRNLPLWLVEGLAEYMSIGREDPHTAMWMRDAVLNEDIPTLKDLTQKPNKYFPYRYGQAFWSFVTGVWGDEVIRPLYLETAKYGYEMAIKNVLGVNAETLGNMWKTKLINTYRPLMNDTTSVVGKLMFDEENAGRLNFMPTLSPDGKYMVFTSERDLISIDMFLVNTETGKVIRKLSKGTMKMMVDDYNYLESPGTFSPDGSRFAFNVITKGINKLMIVNTSNGKTIETLEIPGLESFTTPSWAPDGEHVLVSGLKNGYSDLYLFNINTKEVKNLTNDRYSDIQPAWSADGNTIAFVSDRGSGTDLEELYYGNFKISFLDLLTGKIQVMDKFPGADNMNPQFAKDGTVYFLSNADGFRNIFSYDPITGATYRLTRYFTGISGITETTPALSVAREADKISYSIYKDGRYSIYNANSNDFEPEKFDFYQVSLRASTLPPGDTLSGKRLVMQPDNAVVKEIDDSEFEEKAYEPKFGLSYIGNTGGIGIGTSAMGTGMSGGVNMLFSDMLNDHMLFGGLQVNGEIYDFGGQFAYLNRKSKIYWGGSISHIPFRLMGYGLGKDTLNLEGEEVEVDKLTYLMDRIFQDQVSAFAQLPFSQTLRLEGGVSFSRYSFRRDAYNNYFYQGLQLGQDREKLESPEGFNLGQVHLAYVGDNSQFGLTSPINGQRFRFQVEKVFGANDYYGVLADYRKYIFIKPFTFAFRGLHYGRYGGNAENGFFNRLSLNNDFLVRGYNAGSFVSEGGGDNVLNVNNLQGNSIAVANAEIRFPLTGPEKLALFKSGFLFSDLNLFADAGIAWDSDRNIEMSWEPKYNASTPIVSAGASVRINLFGYLVLEPYYAIPFQRNTGGVTGLIISAGGF